MRVLWLIGMMGAGKTTVGELIARRLGLDLIDTDSLVESVSGLSISAIWERGGESIFRDLESREIERIAADGKDCIVATGGGAVLRPGNVETMRRAGTVVWLRADPGMLASRVLHGSDARPLLRDGPGEDRLAALLSDREDNYAGAAHHQIDTNSKTATEVAREVMELWNGS